MLGLALVLASGRALAGDGLVVEHETLDIPSPARPAETPGTPGVVVTNPKLQVQFGAGPIDLNKARYTRYYGVPALAPQPDAILVLVPGFEGGAGSFGVLADNLVRRAARDEGFTLEVWAYDRRSDQLEDRAGLEVAEDELDPDVGLDWLFGEELGLPLHPSLVAGPDRRAIFYNTTDDLAFFANWTPLVFSRDIDAIVELARATAREGWVFLGGHSAGTGFAAGYAATDFDLSGTQPPQPGYAKLRGLVLLEGGGGSTLGEPPDEDALDLIEARFDGGLFGAVRDGEPRCMDGETACTVATEDVDCAGFRIARCVEPVAAYAVFGELLNPRLLSTLDILGIQMAAGDANSGVSIVQRDFGKGNNAVDVVDDLAAARFLPTGTAQGALGSFVDDDGPIANLASFVAMSVGAPGPVVGDVLTWLDIEQQLPPEVLPDNGAPPTDLPAGVWGQEVESTLFSRIQYAFFEGGTNFTDWYYPSSGLFVTLGLDLDTSALSLDPPQGRGRRDIANQTLAARIDIPVIGLGGTNGGATTPSAFLPFALSIAPCAAESCDGSTPRVVDPASPSEAFPTFGGAAGGFEVHLSEGYSHVDIVAAQDDETNDAVGPIVAFLVRNTVPEPSSALLQVASLLGLGALRTLRRARLPGGV